MKKNYLLSKIQIINPLFLFFLILVSSNFTFAVSGTSLRRPISPEQPMWLVHIDTWNYADPPKIIDLIPKDIRPFVVMNISLFFGYDADSVDIMTPFENIAADGNGSSEVPTLFFSREQTKCIAIYNRMFYLYSE